MKKKGFIVLIYIVIILIVFGSLALTVFAQNPIYIYLMFGFFFFLSILALPFYLKKFKKEYQRQEKMEKDDVIEEINQQDKYNRLEYNVHQVKNIVDVWKQSSKADIIKGLLFVSFFIGCIIATMVFMSMGNMVLGFVCFGLGAGEIILALIVVKFFEARSLRINRKRTYTKATALVLACTMSSQITTGSSRNHTHIRGTTYKVFLSDNRIAYSKEYYVKGEKVDINIDTKNPKRVHIIGTHEDTFDFEENEY